MANEYYLSFCTVSMNRLNHFSQTILRNLEDNADYSELEFVLLDYNSSDGLENWVMENLQRYISSGRLIYYRTVEPRYFHRSHARNLAFRLASGEIVCNVDADNFTGKGFASNINKHFHKNQNSFLAVDFTNREINKRDTYGRIACMKKDFIEIRGFDEKMDGYGYEDIDFCSRLKRKGLREFFIDDEQFLKIIKHSDDERVINEKNAGQHPSVYIHFISPFRSEVLYFFPDYRFSMGILSDKNEGYGNPSIEGGKWMNGIWKKIDKNIHLFPENAKNKLFNVTDSGNLASFSNAIYYKIHDTKFLNELNINYPIITNHQHFINNLNSGSVRANPGDFGKAVVTKNFMKNALSMSR